MSTLSKHNSCSVGEVIRQLAVSVDPHDTRTEALWQTVEELQANVVEPRCEGPACEQFVSCNRLARTALLGTVVLSQDPESALDIFSAFQKLIEG